MANKPKSSSQFFYEMVAKANLSTRNKELYEQLTRIKDDKENNTNGKGLPLEMGKTLKGVDDEYGNDYIPPLLATIFFTAIFVALVTLATMNPIGGLIIGAIFCLVPLGICLYMTLEELNEYSCERRSVRQKRQREVISVKNNPEYMVKRFKEWLLNDDNYDLAASHLWELACDQELDDALIYEILWQIKYKNTGVESYSKESIEEYCKSIPFDLSDRINRILEIIDTKRDLDKIRYSPLKDLMDSKDVINNLGEMKTIFKSSNQPNNMVNSDSLHGADAPSGEGHTQHSKRSRACPTLNPQKARTTHKIISSNLLKREIFY